MPLPVTRPMGRHQITTHDPSGVLVRPPSPDLAFPPSNGITLPLGAGELHTVKDESKVLSPPVARAAVT